MMMGDMIQSVVDKDRHGGLERDEIDRLSDALGQTGPLVWKWKKYATYPLRNVIVLDCEIGEFPADAKWAYNTPAPEN